ncbi:MAG: hypothetical protein LUD74_05745 [Tannerellaceae bacterium]|nr:hypothetical protein [Tannerellaceae bacterium]
MKAMYYLLSFLLLHTACSSLSKQREDTPGADPMEMPTADPLIELMQPRDTFPIVTVHTNAITSNEFPVYLTLATSYPDTVDVIEGTIYNFSPFNGHFGDRYRMEYYEDGEWTHSLLTATGFPDIGYSLLSDGGRMKTKIYFQPDVPKIAGEYRVTKEIWLILTAEFNLTEQNEISFQPVEKIPEEHFTAKLEKNIFDINARKDSFTLTISNLSPHPIAPYNHYYIEYYNEERKYWYRYYYPSYSDYYWSTNEVLPGHSIEFKIPLFPANEQYGWDEQELYKGKYHYRPGRYRLCKYTNIELIREFSLVPTTPQ